MGKLMTRIGCAALLSVSALTVAGMALPRAAASEAASYKRQANVDTFKIDPAHSSVVFKVKHMGVSYVYGRFNEFSGEVVWDGEDPTKHSIKAEVKATSVDTNSNGRDNHLRGPDFFDSANSPTIVFESTGVKESGSDKYEVEGKLTLHGVTKPINVTIEKVGLADLPRMGKRLGLACEFTVKRSEFGMTYGIDGAVSDEVTILLAFECGVGGR